MLRYKVNNDVGHGLRIGGSVSHLSLKCDYKAEARFWKTFWTLGSLSLRELPSLSCVKLFE